MTQNKSQKITMLHFVTQNKSQKITMLHFVTQNKSQKIMYVEKETSLGRLERKRSLFRARFACLSKVLVFCGKSRCTSKGYVERETSLATLKREGVTFQGSLYSPLKSAGSLWQIEVHQLEVVRFGKTPISNILGKFNI